MQKNVAVTLALIVVFGAFFGKEAMSAVGFAPIQTDSDFLPEFVAPQLSFGIFSRPVDGADAGTAAEAWETFAAYRAAAESYDVAQVNRLSYQLSGACKAALRDPAQSAECNQLMDSVVFFTRNFRQEDFTQAISDSRQAILATDYMEIEGAGAPVKMVMYFVRDPEMKLLGLNFCTGRDAADDVCVETDPAKRDRNNNGWWDDLEAFFRK